MFFDGDLKSGITAALQQDKFVACFVADNGLESQTWENEYLKNPEISSLLITKAILLRLQAGSQEAGFLAEIYPLPKTPTFIVILKGELKGYLVSGTNKDDFIRRTKEAFGDPVSMSPPPPSSVTEAEPSRNSAGTKTTETEGRISGTDAQGSAKIKAFLEERKTRMEAEKKEHDRRLKAAKAADDLARKAAAEDSSPLSPQKEANRKYAALQSERLKKAREERERILKRVEDDKVARRERDNLRKEQARAASIIDEATSDTLSSSLRSPATSRSADCAIQVRLFDGSTIRCRFPSNQTLREHVRVWVDAQRGEGDIPYTFKQILSPLPNRTIGDSEEEESLQNIGLCPSATLILVEVKDFSPAFSGGAGGIAKRTFNAGHGVVFSTISTGVNIVTGALGSLFGSANQPEPTNTPHTAVRNSQQEPPLPPDSQQFYNGNSLSFEPRRDDANKED